MIDGVVWWEYWDYDLPLLERLVDGSVSVYIMPLSLAMVHVQKVKSQGHRTILKSQMLQLLQSNIVL